MRELSVASIAFLALLSLAPSVFAQKIIDCTKIDPPFSAICAMSTTNVPKIIGAAISFIFVIAVVVAIFYLLLGALKWIYSGGDKAAVEGARNTITAAVIGLVILFLVFLVFTVVLTFFGINIVDIKLPSILGGTPACVPSGSLCPGSPPNPFLCCSSVCSGTPLLCN